MTALAAAAAALAVVPLVAILIFLVARGAEALSPTVVLRSPTPSGEGGGLANGLAGSALILGIAAALGLPLGLGTGLYLHEERGSRTAQAVRYLCDVLVGVPSIVFGIVAWGLLVRPIGHFSAWAGGAALAAMLVPVVARTTDELLALVPAPLTEAALALGFPRWRTALGVSLRARCPGSSPGARRVARIAGETAPLLFTALGNRTGACTRDAPSPRCPLQIYTARSAPRTRRAAQAYAAPPARGGDRAVRRAGAAPRARAARRRVGGA
jgi:phosphate transport system permease protein